MKARASAIALREVHEQIHCLLDEALATLIDDDARRRHIVEITAGASTPNVRRGQAAQGDALTRLHTAEVCLKCGAVDEAARSNTTSARTGSTPPTWTPCASCASPRPGSAAASPSRPRRPAPPPGGR